MSDGAFLLFSIFAIGLAAIFIGFYLSGPK
jgi:hypothetical protein